MLDKVTVGHTGKNSARYLHPISFVQTTACINASRPFQKKSVNFSCKAFSREYTNLLLVNPSCRKLGHCSLETGFLKKSTFVNTISYCAMF